MHINNIFHKLKKTYPNVPFRILYNEDLDRNVIVLKRYFYIMKIYRIQDDYYAAAIVDKGVLRGLPCADINCALIFIEDELRKLRLIR